jgi:hypothetical protein
MTMRRIFGNALVLCAIYAFALQTIFALATGAGHAALPQAALCLGGSEDSGSAPAGNGENRPGCGHCILPGCGTQQAFTPSASMDVRWPAAVTTGRLSRADKAARLASPFVRLHPARAPPNA